MPSLGDHDVRGTLADPFMLRARDDTHPGTTEKNATELDLLRNLGRVENFRAYDGQIKCHLIYERQFQFALERNRPHRPRSTEHWFGMFPLEAIAPLARAP